MPTMWKGERKLEHFIIKCEKLEEGRNKKIMEKAEKVKQESRLAYILYKSKEWEETGNMIFKLWHLRKILLKPP